MEFLWNDIPILRYEMFVSYNLNFKKCQSTQITVIQTHLVCIEKVFMKRRYKRLNRQIESSLIR